MIISTFLEYLRNDNELVSLLGEKSPYDSITAYEPRNRNYYPYIVITTHPSNFNIGIDEYRCEVRIVVDDVLLVEPLERRVNYLLNFRNNKGVSTKDETLFYSTFVGNGYLFNFDEDGQMNVDSGEPKKIYERVLNYLTKFRSKE